MNHRVRIALLIGSSFALLGCENQESPLGACDGNSCPSACLALSREGTCDIYEPVCQERVFRAVGCVRDEEGELPPIRTLTVEEQRAEDEQRARPPSVDASADKPPEAAAGADDTDSDDAGAPVPRYPSNALARAFGLFGLWRERSPADRGERLAGYYDQFSGWVTLIDRGEPGGDERSQRNLAHELVHAYQDQQLGLFGALGEGSDGNLARAFLFEGEARLYEMLAWGLLTNKPVDEASLSETFQGDIDRATTIVMESESPHDDLWLLQYGVGARFLLDVWLHGGNRAIRAMHDAPPIGTVHWMRALARRRDERWLTSTRRLSCGRLTPPEGYSSFISDSPGALHLFALLSRALVAQSWERALEWQGDKLETFIGPDNELAASWRIRLTDAATARELARKLSGALPNVLVRSTDAELELRAAEDEELIESWLNLEPCAGAY